MSDPYKLTSNQSGPMLGENNYILTRDISNVVAVAPVPPCAYLSENIGIDPQPDGSTIITQLAGFTWDGPPQHGATLASACHDGIYGDAEKIAAAFGWSLENVLQYGNDVFNQRMEQEGTDQVVREVCYHLVNLAGYPYHEEQEMGFWTWAAGIIGDRLSQPAPKIGSDA